MDSGYQSGNSTMVGPGQMSAELSARLQLQHRLDNYNANCRHTGLTMTIVSHCSIGASCRLKKYIGGAGNYNLLRGSCKFSTEKMMSAKILILHLNFCKMNVFNFKCSTSGQQSCDK